MPKGLAWKRGRLKHITACVGLMEHLQIDGPPIKKDRGACGLPPKSAILAKPDIRADFIMLLISSCKDFTLLWLKQVVLLATCQACSICASEMKRAECVDRSDGYLWKCKRQLNSKCHQSEKSISEGSWFEKSNLTIEEVLKFTYWWCRDMKQWQIKQQRELGSHTVVDWEKPGYHHNTVNHSIGFVNEEGFHTNKIEGRWRQMEAKLLTRGQKKEHCLSYLVEFK